MIENPIPPDLDRNPELVAVFILATVIEAATNSVIASQPHFRGGGDEPRPQTDSYWVASVFMRLTGQMLEATRTYRAMVWCEHKVDPSIDEIFRRTGR